MMGKSLYCLATSSKDCALSRCCHSGVRLPGYARAERRQDAEPPVADLVAEALDDDRAVARDDARGLLLLDQEVHEVARGERVEVVLGLQQLGRLLDGPA